MIYSLSADWILSLEETWLPLVYTQSLFICWFASKSMQSWSKISPINSPGRRLCQFRLKWQQLILLLVEPQKILTFSKLIIQLLLLKTTRNHSTLRSFFLDLRLLLPPIFGLIVVVLLSREVYALVGPSDLAVLGVKLYRGVFHGITEGHLHHWFVLFGEVAEQFLVSEQKFSVDSLF